MSTLPDRIDSTKQEIEISSLRRRARLEQIEEMLAFIAIKSTGGIFLMSGLLEIFLPDFIPSVIPQPMAFAGVGLAMIAGKKSAAKLLDALRKSME